MEIILQILFYIGGMIAVGLYAERLGRGGGGWFIGSIFITPLFGLLWLWCMGEKQKSEKNTNGYTVPTENVCQISDETGKKKSVVERNEERKKKGMDGYENFN